MKLIQTEDFRKVEKRNTMKTETDLKEIELVTYCLIKLLNLLLVVLHRINSFTTNPQKSSLTM